MTNNNTIAIESINLVGRIIDQLVDGGVITREQIDDMGGASVAVPIVLETLIEQHRALRAGGAS